MSLAASTVLLVHNRAHQSRIKFAPLCPEVIGDLEKSIGAAPAIAWFVEAVANVAHYSKYNIPLMYLLIFFLLLVFFVELNLKKKVLPKLNGDCGSGAKRVLSIT